jgi:hypothetical protein
VIRRAAHQVARSIFYLAHPNLRNIKGYGTVQDLYYWVSEGDLDTIVIAQNYFSAFYPLLDTSTTGSITVHSADGQVLGAKEFHLAHCGGTKFHTSSLLAEFEASEENPYGSLELKIDIPVPVLKKIQEVRSIYFWDRFYISYVKGNGPTSFVHGVDKSHIYKTGDSKPKQWHPKPGNFSWAPEMPVNINDYTRFSVIILNRTLKASDATLNVADDQDRSLFWKTRVPGKGVRRFQLTSDDVAGLSSKELRLQVNGMATKFGRPVVFKEFANGAISAMHC